jgi:serine/threonine protein kinase/Tfp pilus assembly protein PilF
MVGKIISHYKILEKLGEGGMGVVYKAQDIQLQRMVALKFLPPHISDHPEEKARFVHEAQSASALNHPNVTTIHQVDEFEGQMFIVMEYIEGKPLKELIHKRTLSIDEILAIALKIAEGLNAAHKKEIVHRDVKSDNVMVTDEGEIKIMDFGLAKLKGATKLTTTGTTLGTLQYMSPEQAQGKEVDQRSDIFSFGVVLYEMITGQLPFKGEHEAAIIYSIINEIPEPLARYKANVPEGLQRIVDKTLEKDRNIRYQSAAEVIADLKGLQREKPVAVAGKPKKKLLPFIVPAAIVFLVVLLFLIFKPFKVEIGPDKRAIAKENSLAIMYFENLADKEDQLLGDMITNLLITDLAESEYIQVVSYQRLYDILKILGKERSKKIDRSVATEVAKKAGVNNMLLGSISQLGEKKILTSTVVDVSSGTVRKSQKVEGTDIFVMVDQLTREVKNDLSLPEKALAEQDKPIAELSTKSEDAYRHYVRGLDYEYSLLHKEALEQYQKALEYDSTFAMVHYHMRNTYGWLGNDDLAAEAWKKALRDSVKAPEKDRMYIRALEFELESDPLKAGETYREIISRYPDEKEAYQELGYVQDWLGDYSAAKLSYEKALQLDPHSYWAVRGLRDTYMALKNHEQAKILMENYVSLEPNDSKAHLSLASLYLDLKEYDNALKECRIALELEPDFWLAHLTLGRVYRKMKEYGKAEEVFKKMGEIGGVLQKLTSLRHLAFSYFAEGRFEEGFKCLKETLEMQKQRGEIGHARDLNEVGSDYLDLNRPDLALEYFEKVKSFAPDEYDGFRVAKIYLIKKNFNKAQEIMDADIKGMEGTTNPDEIAGFQNHFMGILEREKGNYKEAIKYLKKAKELCRDLNDYLHGFELGKVYLLGKNFSKAEEEFVKQMEDDNPYPINYIKSHYYLAKAKEGLNKKKEAIAYYEEFLGYWGNADWELPEIKDAKVRLQKLRGENGK